MSPAAVFTFCKSMCEAGLGRQFYISQILYMWGEKKPPNKLPKTEISKKIYTFKIIIFLFFFNYDTDNNIMTREHNAVRNVP